MELGDGAVDAGGESEVVCVDDEVGRHGVGRLILRDSSLMRLLMEVVRLQLGRLRWCSI